ncbi:UNVERIFIED_CONTAM: hypothetical protein Sradi_3079400 [Sesamum radiatum]|uniref:Uncharacterized protein n=1 Tax=Sesamum radiatum TaxID=300843 RepID=A0AAW2RCB6_SESRA
MANSPSPKGIAAIVGVGAKLGRSIARKFATKATPSPSSPATLVIEICRRDSEGRKGASVRDPHRLLGLAEHKGCVRGGSLLGFVEVLVYNAYHPVSWTPTSFTGIRLDHSRNPSPFPPSAPSTAPNRFPNNSFKLLVGCGKFALRALSQCLAREFQPLGVHVAHVIIDGIVGAPRGSSMPSTSHQRSSTSSSVGEQQQIGGGDGYMDPDVLAQTYWQLHVQDRSTWTQEMDLRPGGPRLF